MSLVPGGFAGAKFGPYLSGGVTYDNQLRAGVSFGMNFTADLLQMTPVSVNSTIAIELQYEVTLDTAGVVVISVVNANGQLQYGHPTFQVETTAGTHLRTATGTAQAIPFFAYSNTIGFTILSSTTGTFRTKHLKVTINHA